MGERDHQPAGTAAQIHDRSRAAVEQPTVVARGIGVPSPDSEHDLGPVAAQQPGGRSPQGGVEGPG
jgi:hypothetical protein